jgi:hypothetical protein
MRQRYRKYWQGWQVQGGGGWFLSSGLDALAIHLRKHLSNVSATEIGKRIELLTKEEVAAEGANNPPQGIKKPARCSATNRRDRC